MPFTVQHLGAGGLLEALASYRAGRHGVGAGGQQGGSRGGVGGIGAGAQAFGDGIGQYLQYMEGIERQNDRQNFELERIRTSESARAAREQQIYELRAQQAQQAQAAEQEAMQQAQLQARREALFEQSFTPKQVTDLTSLNNTRAWLQTSDWSEEEKAEGFAWLDQEEMAIQPMWVPRQKPQFAEGQGPGEVWTDESGARMTRNPKTLEAKVLIDPTTGEGGGGSIAKTLTPQQFQTQYAAAESDLQDARAAAKDPTPVTEDDVYAEMERREARRREFLERSATQPAGLSPSPRGGPDGSQGMGALRMQDDRPPAAAPQPSQDQMRAEINVLANRLRQLVSQYPNAASRPHGAQQAMDEIRAQLARLGVRT